ncbi:hypothetical protein AJ80_02476 [Polytolypa hystricis UAMH7299]|uniref:Mitochondrial thiamine pyrophosphate carrier 1 n=1 Tax=Polytolypa hystricis (strain UAMH7299) TaxID=1447883 RepID=A0A2B7YRN4_POLH7|nr:hypothetical protein AJ80_02476 [Polytolypa hystricis UAMH7299]
MAGRDKTQQTASTQSAPSSSSKIHYPFWFGGSASSCAAASRYKSFQANRRYELIGAFSLLIPRTQQVRLQTRKAGDPSSMFRTFIHVVKHNGVLGLYRGLSASLLRQMTYSTTRFGVYEELKARLTPASSSTPPSLPVLIALASGSGFIGGVIGNPADVLNVRMQSDAGLPPEKRRNYKNVVDGLVRMLRSEGPRSLFLGVWPNSARATLMTAAQLASYDEFKGVCFKLGMSDNLATHFTASLMAGFTATTIASPVDVIKTRVMSAGPETKGHGLMRVLRDICRNEGYVWMFRGWVPSFVRLGPHTVVTFLFLEEHKKIYRAWTADSKSETAAVL